MIFDEPENSVVLPIAPSGDLRSSRRAILKLPDLFSVAGRRRFAGAGKLVQIESGDAGNAS